MSDDTGNPKPANNDATVMDDTGLGLDADGTVIDPEMASKRKLAPVEGAELQPGDILGKVKIDKEVGRGGMGAVYVGQHTTLDVPVAVKVLPPEIAAKHEQFAQRFMKEGQLAAKVNHPNVMGVLDVDQDPKTELYYIVLEFVDGGSVRDKMMGGPLSEVETIDIGLSVAQALDAAADVGIVHRDIKPDNIMLNKKGVVKLADMGIAKQANDDQSITMSNAMMGTPAYISPEQAMDAKSADARADIYSLGASMYHMLIGAPPYEGETTYAVLTKLATDPTPDPRVRRPDLSDDVANVIMKMMDKDKNRRHQSAKELVEELSMIRSRIATRATAMISGGQVTLMDMPSTPQGTPTQGIVGTAATPPAQPNANIATAPEMHATAPAQPTTATTVPTVGAGSNALALGIAFVAILLVGAVAVILALKGNNPSQTQTPTPAVVSQTPTPASAPAAAPVPTTPGGLTPPPGFAPAPQPAQQGGEISYQSPTATPAQPDTAPIDTPVPPLAKTPPATPPTPTASVTPLAPPPAIDEDLVAEAIAALESLPEGDIEKGTAQFKNKETPDMLATPEVRLVGFGSTPEKARQAAMENAVNAVLEQVVDAEEQATKKAELDAMRKNADSYMRVNDTFAEKQANGNAFIALSVTPRTGKIGKDLYENKVAVRDLYALIGQPTIGIDMPEVFDNKDKGEKESRLRRAQRALERELRKHGATTVDVTGVDKNEQREYCDILITGTSLATLRGAAPLPGGSQPVFIYNAELGIAIQMSATKRQIFNEIFTFKPKGMEEARAYADFDSDEAAKKVLEAAVKANLDSITHSILDEWVKLSGDVDFWVGISGLTGGRDVLEVKKNLGKLPGVSRVVPRYYKDNTQYVGLIYAEAAEKLIETMIEAGYNLNEQRGTMLIFDRP